MITILGWIGASALALAPFIIAKYPRVYMGAAIMGLAFLIPQAYQADLYNLVALNTISIIGFLTSLLGKRK